MTNGIGSWKQPENKGGVVAGRPREGRWATKRMRLEGSSGALHSGGSAQIVRDRTPGARCRYVFLKPSAPPTHL